MTEAITQTIYNGKYTITLDEDHVYHVDYTEAKPLGVTTPIKLLDKAFLGPWYAKECSLSIIANCGPYIVEDEFGQRQLRIAEDEFVQLCTDAKFAAKRISEEAKEIGTQVHAFAEEYTLHQKAPMPEHPMAVKCCTSLVEWIAQPGRRTIATERPLFSATYFFAGKVDRVDEIGGELEVVDYKTSSGFYGNEYPIQLSGYAIAWEEEFGQYIKWGRIVRIDKKTGKIEERRYELTDKHKDCFLALLDAAKRLNELETKNAVSKAA